MSGELHGPVRLDVGDIGGDWTQHVVFVRPDVLAAEREWGSSWRRVVVARGYCGVCGAPSVCSHRLVAA